MKVLGKRIRQDVIPKKCPKKHGQCIEVDIEPGECKRTYKCSYFRGGSYFWDENKVDMDMIIECDCLNSMEFINDL